MLRESDRVGHKCLLYDAYIDLSFLEVADAIRTDPDTWNEAILGYANWLLFVFCPSHPYIHTGNLENPISLPFSSLHLGEVP